jgi:phosphatidylinositol-3-phosphatase
MTAMRIGWRAGARGALVLLGAALLGAALLGAAGWVGQASAATTGTQSARAAAVSWSTPSASHPCGTQSKHGTIKHVIFIVLENKSYGAILGSSQAPYFNTLAKDCGVATNYHNITHPSLPNYIAMTSGLPLSSLQEFVPDCVVSSSCDTPAQSIFSQGETWKAYEESMPSNCYPSNSGLYVARHNPAAYYTSLSDCSSDDVSYSHLASDLAHNQLPAFSFITPNLIDDMHNGTVADGNSWMSKNLPTILNSSEYKNGSTVIFITFDEGSDVGSYANGENCAANISDTSCHLPTFVISPSTKVGARNGTLFNHYSLLGTAEQLLGLPKLGQAADFPTMVSAFNL